MFDSRRLGDPVGGGLGIATPTRAQDSIWTAMSVTRIVHGEASRSLLASFFRR
jgi:hypothetical protein